MNRFPSIDTVYISGVRNFNKTKIKLDAINNIIIGPNGVGKSTFLTYLKMFFTGPEYHMGASVKEKQLDFVITFNRLQITQDTVKQFKLDENLSKCIVPVDDELIETQIEQYAIEHTGQQQRGQPTPNFTPVDTSEILGKEGSFITYLFKRDGYYIDPGSQNPGYILVDNKLYSTIGIRRKNILEIFRDGILDFNLGDRDEFYSKLIGSLENEKELNRKFIDFKTKATTTINKLFNSGSQKIDYVSIPRMETKVLNSDGKDVNDLSSGERQYERLKLFNSAKKQTTPKLVLIDEPELHLNYGQLSYLSEIIEDLKKDDCQLFIASHSPYFPRTVDRKSLVYLKLSKEKNVIQILLREAPIKNNLVQFPELFFAEHIILVEAFADAIFFQRSIDVLLKKKSLISLASKNIYVIATGGKSAFNNVINFDKKYLGLNYIVISDLDFMLNQNHYKFLSDKSKKELASPLSKIANIDIKKSITEFKSLSITQAQEFIDFLDSVFFKGSIRLDEKKRYEDYKKLTKGYVYDPKKIKSRDIKKIRSIFTKENVWILENIEVEKYVNQKLLLHGKLSVDKLNELFYPETENDLKSFSSNDSIRELNKITELIIVNFYK